MLITGYRSRGKPMGQLRFTCTKCGQNSFHQVVRMERHFTVFWIPLFPIAKFTTLTCNNCGYKSSLKNDQADKLLAQAGVAAPGGQRPS